MHKGGRLMKGDQWKYKGASLEVVNECKYLDTLFQ